MSRTPKFRIQPRDVCPGDYLKYLESKNMNYSNHALSLVNNLQDLMSQYRHKKKINTLLHDNIKKLEERHNKTEKLYDQVRQSFFKVQKKIFLLSNSIGRITQKQVLINARNKKINDELKVEGIRSKMEEVNANTTDNKSNSEYLNNFLKEYEIELDNIRKKYFGDYKDKKDDEDNKDKVDYYFKVVKDELHKRRLEYDLLLNEIDQNNRRMFADSLNRTNLMKL